MSKFCLKLYVKLRKEIDKLSRTPVDPREIRARSLALKMINARDSVLKICPKTGKRFILNDRLGLSIIINLTHIDFFEDALHSVMFCKNNYYIIVNRFDDVASKNREVLEEKIKSRTQNSFDDMYDNLIHS